MSYKTGRPRSAVCLFESYLIPVIKHAALIKINHSVFFSAAVMVNVNVLLA